MEGDVKRRPYRSERRREQAEETRVKVLDAAAALFEERGYEGASIAAIAAAAGVSEETIYARFGTKRAVLGELVARAVRGADPRPVPEQAGPRSLAAASDQREQLRLFAADIAERLERAAPLVTLVGGAARAEPELAELLERLHDERLRNLRVLVDSLLRNGPLRLPEKEALETVWALTSPELHQLLVRVRGWSRSRYRAWLADSLATLLLPSG
jgi:AcrR family transcriptional regulator